MIEILEFNPVNRRPRRIGRIERLLTRRRLHRKAIKRPDRAAAPIGDHVHTHGTDALRQCYAIAGHPLVLIPCAGVGYIQRPGYVLSVDQDFELTPAPHARHPGPDRVCPPGGGIEHITHPFAGLGPAHCIPVAGTGILCNVHGLTGAIFPALVGGCRLVIA